MDVVTHTHYPSPQEVKAGVHSLLHNMSEANLGYGRPCLKRFRRGRRRKKMSLKSTGSQEANLDNWITRNFETRGLKTFIT